MSEGAATDSTAPIGDLIEYLVKGLVDDPEAVVIDEFEEDDGTIVFELTVADGDYGKIIGRGGRTVSALRTLAKAAAVRTGHRVLLDVVD